MDATVDRMPKKKKPPTESIRINKEIVRQAGFVANHEGKTVPDLLNEILAPIMNKRYEEVIALLAAKLPANQGRPRKPT